jgi:ABC-2 type transport system permease protein
MKPIIKTVKMEALLYIRSFFGLFFSLVFPLMMLFLYGGIYGNEPTPYFGGRGAMDVSVPAYLNMVIAVSGLMTLPLGLSEYQKLKVYKRFDATPIGKGNLALAQLSVYFASCVLSSAVLVAAGILAYHIRIDGAWYVIAPAFLLSVLSMFSIGFLIAALFKNTKVTQLVSYILYFLMLFTSGATVPTELFPEGLKFFTQFVPLTHAVTLMRGTFTGKPLGDMAGSVIVLSAVMLVCGAFGIICYRRRSTD